MPDEQKQEYLSTVGTEICRTTANRHAGQRNISHTPIETTTLQPAITNITL